MNPLLEITVAGPLHGGVHAVRLADHGLSLEPGRWYEWSVSVVTGGRDPSEDRISRGFIMRTPVPAGLTQQLEKRGPDQAVNVFAEAGLWYDAITALSVGIETQAHAEGRHCAARAQRCSIRWDSRPSRSTTAAARHERASGQLHAQAELHAVVLEILRALRLQLP